MVKFECQRLTDQCWARWPVRTKYVAPLRALCWQAGWRPKLYPQLDQNKSNGSPFWVMLAAGDCPYPYPKPWYKGTSDAALSGQSRAHCRRACSGRARISRQVYCSWVRCLWQVLEGSCRPPWRPEPRWARESRPACKRKASRSGVWTSKGTLGYRGFRKQRGLPIFWSCIPALSDQYSVDSRVDSPSCKPTRQCSVGERQFLQTVSSIIGGLLDV
jgi:hypothetical protein